MSRLKAKLKFIYDTLQNRTCNTLFSNKHTVKLRCLRLKDFCMCIKTKYISF